MPLLGKLDSNVDALFAVSPSSNEPASEAASESRVGELARSEAAASVEAPAQSSRAREGMANENKKRRLGGLVRSNKATARHRGVSGAHSLGQGFSRHSRRGCGGWWAILWWHLGSAIQPPYIPTQRANTY